MAMRRPVAFLCCGSAVALALVFYFVVMAYPAMLECDITSPYSGGCSALTYRCHYGCAGDAVTEVPATQTLPPGDVLITTVVTSELIAFTHNWLCSIAALRLRRAAVLVTALNDRVCEELSPWRQAVAHTCIQHGYVGERRAGPVSYKSRNYLRGTADKLERLSALLHVDGVDRYRWVIFADVDLVFHRDPVRYLDAHHAGERRALLPRDYCDRDFRLNSGVVAMAGSNGSRALLRAARHALNERKSDDGTDQGAFQYAGSPSNMLLLPCDRFAPGHTLGRGRLSGLVTFHANWARSSATKLRCLQVSGQWMRREPPALCGPLSKEPPLRLAREGDGTRHQRTVVGHHDAAENMAITACNAA